MMLYQLLPLAVLVATATASAPPQRQAVYKGSDVICDGKVDVVFIIDASASINSRTEFPAVEKLFNNILDALTVNEDAARVGIVTFSPEATLIQQFLGCNLTAEPQSRQCVKDVINSLDATRIRGRTNIADAFRTTREEVINGPGNRPGIDNVCIFFSDGEANEEVDDTLPEAEKLEKVCRIISVGIDEADKVLLQQVSSSNDVFIINGTDFDELLKLVGPIVQGTCRVTGNDPITDKCDCVNLPASHSNSRKRRFAGEDL